MQTESYHGEIPRTAEGEGRIRMDYGVPLPSWTQVVSRHGSRQTEKERVRAIIEDSRCDLADEWKPKSFANHVTLSSND
jgi:hypothetical protein